VKDIRHGEVVEISGPVERSGEILTAPATGRACVVVRSFLVLESHVAWNYRVDVLRDERAVDFYLRAGRDRVLVRAAGTDLHMSGIEESGVTGKPEGRLRELLRQQETAFDGSGLLQVRWRERVVCEGDHATVRGRASIEVDPEPGASRAGYREEPMRIVLAGTLEIGVGRHAGRAL